MREADPAADPDNFSFYYFAAVQALAAAMADAGSEEPKAVAKALREGTFATAVGELAFDDKGDLKAPEYVFFEWRDGRYAPAF
jgi:branched-chain amino acid transport system substrate-binding protein